MTDRQTSCCTIADCGGRPHARGMCNIHYARWRRHGDPTAGRIADGTAAEYLRNVAALWQADECLLWPFYRDPNGYGRVSRRLAHRVVCEIVHGKPESSRMEAAHSCGNGHLGCVSGNHLRWATKAENAADTVAHGRSHRGSHPMAKLVPADVVKIRELIGTRTTAELADAYGVSKSAIDLIRNRKRWAWL